MKAVEARAAARIAEYGPEIMRYVEKAILLQTLDHNWREHIVNLDHLRQYVGLRGYGQRDPLNEYKSEAFELFEAPACQAAQRSDPAGDAGADSDRRPAAAAGAAAPARHAGLAYRSAHRRGRDSPMRRAAAAAARSIPTIPPPGTRFSAMRHAPVAPGENSSIATGRWPNRVAPSRFFARYRVRTPGESRADRLSVRRQAALG